MSVVSFKNFKNNITTGSNKVEQTIILSAMTIGDVELSM
jgi:hypothetical protein